MKKPFNPCSIPECAGNASTGGLGLCSKHYYKHRRYGDPLKGKTYAMHGMSYSRLQNIWSGMLYRCGHYKSVRDRDAKYYSQKGVRVCSEWLDFVAFSHWANANGYADNLTIDRIDSDGNYEPRNCRWVTARENQHSKKNLKLTQQDADDIRAHVGAGASRAALSGRYEVSLIHINSIARGERWNHAA